MCTHDHVTIGGQQSCTGQVCTHEAKSSPTCPSDHHFNSTEPLDPPGDSLTCSGLGKSSPVAPSLWLKLALTACCLRAKAAGLCLACVGEGARSKMLQRNRLMQPCLIGVCSCTAPTFLNTEFTACRAHDMMHVRACQLEHEYFMTCTMVVH
jgi:hypothetical protein